ncbi:hypothetical protein X769_20750 [Mesorhizobium sp. LSJC268A00]|nr:hypothetical protein X773_10695 [Mesorhizobium sp. LSJC285A00]ESW84447.1 hypothetical protein X770_23900 [Mesorhizobium sp. LSJC269B00]ESX01690.1 hypothetical protein X769_20750 [Mesorhizobium sp. LSJC268A00]ESX91762.1 hypothetical protein X754_21955 [Mesorhizobium sp. LNJC403B00]ESZ07882.1 hypothetical protein X736_10395 [Mesorhizobium sp. L2C089B000]ESZ12115.1 hypothetical protein X735_23850 [Mesorhizobium sp. L2C085B000]ESZ33898.1 hypothetical protein X733_16390 [Mesorhizobium sp. L2C06
MSLVLYAQTFSRLEQRPAAMSVALSPLAAKTFPIGSVPLRPHAATFLNPIAEIVSPQCLRENSRQAAGCEWQLCDDCFNNFRDWLM